MTIEGRKVKSELFEHLPFTAFGVCLGLILVAVAHIILSSSGTTKTHEGMEGLFYIFHALHIFLAALTSTAVSFRVGRDPIRASLISAFTTIPFCILSDAIMPYLGGHLFQMDIEFHISAPEQPLVVFSFLVFGILSGLVSEKKIGRVSYFSHSAHVLLSSFASMFYLVGYGADNWVKTLGPLFLITFVAVIIPCCMSDIVFPISFTHAEHDHPHI